MKRLFYLGLWFVLWIDLVFLTPVWSQTPCQSDLGSCDYYRCRESLQLCGEEGYFTKLAYPYCSQLTIEVRPSLTQEGQDWMDKAARCLRDQLELFSVPISCDEIKDQAIATHAPCYLDTGFCQIQFLDKWRIFEKIYKALSDSRMLKVFFEIASNC